MAPTGKGLLYVYGRNNNDLLYLLPISRRREFAVERLADIDE
jgi:hypothetical protein